MNSSIDPMSVSLSLRDAICHFVRVVPIRTNGPTTGGRYRTGAAVHIALSIRTPTQATKTRSVQLSLETIVSQKCAVLVSLSTQGQKDFFRRALLAADTTATVQLRR